jgi:hypothetical protein
MATIEPVKANTTIVFGETCVTPGSEGFQLELDSTKNGDLSQFAANTDVYIKVYPGNFLPEYGQTSGNLRIDATGLYEDLTDEEIIFTKADTGSLQKWCASLTSYKWIGNVLHTPDGNPPSMTIVRNTITLSAKVTGILRVTYRAVYDRIVLNAAIKTIVEAYKEDPSTIDPDLTEEMYGYIVIDYIDDTTTERDVYVTIKDACTRTNLVGAKVYISPGRPATASGIIDEGASIYKGVTDANGRIHLGKLKKGWTYAIKSVMDGYLDTDVDTIQNDFFTVQ